MQRPAGNFLPPLLSPLVVRACWPINSWWLRHMQVGLEIGRDDLDRLQSVSSQAGVLLAFNHVSYMDAFVVGEVSRRARMKFYYVASRHLFNRAGGVYGWMMRHCGTFSVDPGGPSNQASTQFAIEALRQRLHPIVIFPEGHTFYQNDVILPLKPGVAQWACQAASQGYPTCVLPVALKYRFQGDISEVLDRAVTVLEDRVIPDASPVPRGDVWSHLYVRLFRLGDLLLRRLERRYHCPPPPHADVDERLVSLGRHLVGMLERRHGVAEPGGDVFSRARHLMRILEDARDPSRRRDAATARLAWGLSQFHANYLSPEASPERFAETVMKLHREVFDEVPLGLRLPRVAHVRVGEPLDAAAYATGDGAPALLADLSRSLQNLVDAMGAQTPRQPVGVTLQGVPMPT